MKYRYCLGYSLQLARIWAAVMGLACLMWRKRILKSMLLKLYRDGYWYLRMLRLEYAFIFQVVENSMFCIVLSYSVEILWEGSLACLFKRGNYRLHLLGFMLTAILLASSTDIHWPYTAYQRFNHWSLHANDSPTQGTINPLVHLGSLLGMLREFPAYTKIEIRVPALRIYAGAFKCMQKWLDSLVGFKAFERDRQVSSAWLHKNATKDLARWPCHRHSSRHQSA